MDGSQPRGAWGLLSSGSPRGVSFFRLVWPLETVHPFFPSYYGSVATDRRDAMVVELREVNAQTVRAVCALGVAPEQDEFVASNALSIAQAHFEPNHWMRAIFAGDEPAGFLLTKEDRQRPLYYLWRFMIDEKYQRRGIGRRAMTLLLDRWRSLGAAEGVLSVIEENGSAIAFYESLGFRLTGERAGDELVMRVQL